jgi:hypothetical protein
MVAAPGAFFMRVILAIVALFGAVALTMPIAHAEYLRAATGLSTNAAKPQPPKHSKRPHRSRHISTKSN